MQTLNLEFEFASLNIAITAKATTFLFGQSSLEFRTHIFTRRKLLLPNFPNNSIKFDASTPSEPTVAPKSLRSRSESSLVRHMSGAAFGTGLRSFIFHAQCSECYYIYSSNHILITTVLFGMACLDR